MSSNVTDATPFFLARRSIRRRRGDLPRDRTEPNYEVAMLRDLTVEELRAALRFTGIRVEIQHGLPVLFKQNPPTPAA